MTDTSISDLNYGHYGLPIYDVDSQKWHFARRHANARPFRFLGPLKTSIPPAICRSNSAHVERSARHREKKIKSLVRRYPELCAAQSLLPSLERVSDASTSAEQYSTVEGDRLAFGRAAEVGSGNGKGRIRIVAIPTGSSGSDIRLVHVRNERQGWRKDKGIWLQVPCLTGDSGYWTGEGAPIRQLCFSISDERGTFLAARLPTRVQLFRPLYHRSPALSQQFQKYASSRLEPNPILSISIERTGGSPHADITFNPWYQRQFAIIDQAGNWSVWDMSGKQYKRQTYSASLFKAGNISNQLSFEPPQSIIENTTRREDGWARIAWVADIHTLIICNRRELVLVDIRGTPLRIVSPNLNIRRTADWILDIKTSPLRKEQFFVLTTTKLYILQYSRPNNDYDEVTENEACTVLLSWRHFRNSEDFTMKLSVTAIDEEIISIIYSPLNPITTSIRFAQSPNIPSAIVITSDPTELFLPIENYYPNMSRTGLINTNLEPLEYYENSRSDELSCGTGYRNGGIRFVRVTFLYENLKIEQSFLYSYDLESGSWDIKERIPSVEMLSWAKKSSLSAPKLNDNDFIAMDHEEGYMEEQNSSMKQRKMSRYNFIPQEMHNATQNRDAWMVSNERLYKLLTNVNKMEGENLATICQNIRDYMDGSEIRAEQPFGVLSDFIDTAVKIDELNQCSDAFEELLSSVAVMPEADEFPLEVKRIAAASVLGLPDFNQSEDSLSQIYMYIIDLWISNLPSKSAGQLRLAKERIALKIAAEISLASARIRFQKPVPTEDPVNTAVNTPIEETWSGTFTLPVRPPRVGIDDEMSNSPSQSIFSLLEPGLPTPEATPSLVSRSSYTSTMSSLGGISNQLKEHLQMTKPAPHLSTSLTQLLAHWTFGTDPELYDWEVTTAAIATEGAVEGLTEKERRRLRHRAQKHLKKQRKESQRASAAAISSSQPVLQTTQHEILPRSSPGPPQTFMNSSQSAWGMSSQVIMASQTERGSHGGRPTKRKKTRQQGF